jgi:hypothetical protein
MEMFIDGFSTQMPQEQQLKMFWARFQRCRDVDIFLTSEKKKFGSNSKHSFGLNFF